MKSDTAWFFTRRFWILAWQTVTLLVLVAVSLVAEEKLGADLTHSTRLFHALIVFLALLCFASVVLVVEYFAKRELSSLARLANDRLRMAVIAGKSVAWDLDDSTGHIEWMGDLPSMFGIPSETFSGQVQDFYRRVHPEDQRRVAHAVSNARENRKRYQAEFRVVHEDGTVRWVRASGEFLYSKKGDPVRMLGTAIDITERRQADQALIKSEEKFSKAFQESPMALTLTSAKDHRYLDVNETFERISGWRRDEVVGRTPFDINLWVDPAQRAEMAKEVQTKGTVRNLELRFRCKDGEERDALGSAELIEIDGEACVISVVADITERKLMEQQLREKDLRLAGIIGSTMDAIIAVDEEQRIALFNPAAEKMFGCSASEAMGSALDRFIPQRFHSEHRAHMSRFAERGATGREHLVSPLNSVVGLRSNGEEFPIEASISQVQTSGGILFTAIVRDVTERRRADESLRKSEERLRVVANTAPVMIWMSGTDKLCIYFNKPWLDFTGRPLGAELGNGWAEGVHGEDRDQCWRIYSEAFDRGESFRMEYRLRRHDGEYRWILDIGVPRFNPDNSPAGYIGFCLDVTEMKVAEASLATMGRRLIEAHEEERAWIGRELHDDINQRLALLAVELDQWNQQATSGPEIHEHIRHAQERIAEIAKDVQGLSHHLHSSKLEYLGLASAANSFCRELSEKNMVKVHFRHAGIPGNLPKEISLCLFRVLQESLQNAVKHSGVRDFNVELRGKSEEIELTVTDAGVGFNVQDAMHQRGLGLISMRERLQLVNGYFSMETKPGQGTTVRARVPVPAKESRQSMAG